MSGTTGSARDAISVEGNWGYSAVTPSDVELACLVLAVDAYRKRFGDEGESSGLVTPDGVRVLPAAFPSRVRDLLAPYRRVI